MSRHWTHSLRIGLSGLFLFVAGISALVNIALERWELLVPTLTLAVGGVMLLMSRTGRQATLPAEQG
jgi:hypothetical protein